MKDPSRSRLRRDLRTAALYAWALLREFRWTLFTIVLAVLVGGALYELTPSRDLEGARPPLLVALYGAWMALFAQPLSRPETWYLAVMQGVYPLLGFVVLGEGIARFALLMISRRRGEKEWMKVMASTHREHVVLCGIGHLGYRVLQQLVARDAEVVAVEKDEGGRFVAEARALRVPLLIRDMKDDQTLIDAGVPHAQAIIIATNDDMANMEVALDARRLNPTIRIVMRLFDQQLASKIKDAFHVDYAFSASALAAASVAAMTFDCRILAAYELCGAQHVDAEIGVDAGSALDGKTVGDVEREHGARLLCRTPTAGAGGAAAEAPPAAGSALRGGDVIAVHVKAQAVNRLIAAARSATSSARARS